MTVLVVTVGGSPKPVVAALKGHRPDRTIFVCSADSPTAKGSWREVGGIAAEAGIANGTHEVIQLGDFDSIDPCYREIARLLERLRAEHPEARIVVDYTGGTKSMSAAAAAAALDDERCELSLVYGTRVALGPVKNGSEVVLPVGVWDLRAMRRLGEVRTRLAKFDYAGATSLLEAIARAPLNRGLRDAVVASIAICRGLDAWDRFDHAGARALLEPYRRNLVNECIMLDDLCRAAPRDPYIRAEDLVLNAERRAEQGRYDDAVARTYRALELIAQTRLRAQYDIDTSKVDTSRLPEEVRSRLERLRGEDGSVRLALVSAWELLHWLRDPAVGEWFREKKAAILGLLEVRNHSILAHGNQPIGAGIFGDCGRRLADMCREAMQRLADQERRRVPVVQLPREVPPLCEAMAGAE